MMTKKINIEPLALLTGIREILSKPEAWTKGILAFDKDKKGIDPVNPEACRFCLLGAAGKAANFSSLYHSAELETLYHMLRKELRQYVGDAPGTYTSVSDWNDQKTRTHDEVLKFLDTRIAHHLGVKAPA